MKGIIFLLVLMIIYYQIYKRYPERLSFKTHMYFALFITVFLTLYYLMSYQKVFVYQMMKNIKDVDDQSLYDINSLSYKENQMVGLKNNLAMRQGWRCINCQNPLLQKDMHEYKVNYLTPLQFGGNNDINNLGIICADCSSFRPY